MKVFLAAGTDGAHHSEYVRSVTRARAGACFDLVKLIVTGMTCLAFPVFNAHAADRGDSFASMLMDKGIEAYSVAGAKGDEKAADALLDQDVLFSGGDGAVQHDEKRDRTDAISALLKRKTQALLEVSERGDNAARNAYLDADLLFVDEDGIVRTRRDVESIAPGISVKGLSASDTVTQWVLHQRGNVAVSSFVDEQVNHPSPMAEHGQISLKYLLVQTWRRHGSAWKLFGSHTIPLHQDPAPAALPESLWNEYAGAYQVAPGVVAVLKRDGEGLTSSTNGAKPVRYVPESVDVFYSPGMPAGALRPRIFFQRDAAGRVAGYVSSGGVVLHRLDDALTVVPAAPAGITSAILPARDLVVHRAGNVAIASFIHERVTQYYGQELHTNYRSTETWVKDGSSWKMLTLQSRAMENVVSLPPVSKLAWKDYIGSYEFAGQSMVAIVQEGETLLMSGKDGKPHVLNPLAHDFFTPVDSPRTSVIFERDASGRVTGYLSRREGHDLAFVKV
ncbi:MAG TPA: hypothetical protein VIF60_17370 [Burkholderiaceae bacterium]|jgi:hypothetical protein